MQLKQIRLLAIILSILFTLSFAVACGSSNGGTTTTTTEAGQTTTQGEDESDDETEETTTEAPSGERKTLSVEVFDRGTTGQTPVDNNYWTNWIQQEFGDPNNIDVEFVVCPRSEEVDTLNAWMAGGTAPDLVLTYNNEVVYNYYLQNGLTDWTESLNAYGSDLKSFLGDDALTYGNFDGFQAAIPAKRVMQARHGAFIRADWCETLGIDIPETIDELYDALVMFRDENPGNVDRVVPFAANDDMNWGMQGFREAFREDVDERTLFVYQPFNIPGVKEGIRYINKLYNEGLVSSEFYLDSDGSMLDADIIRGAAGAYISNYDMAFRDVPGHSKELLQNVPEGKLVPFDPFKNVHTGKYTKEIYDPTGVKILNPVFSDATDEAIMYLNWMTDPDVIFHLQYGEEGIGHTYVDGIPKVLPVEGEKMFPSMQNIDYTLILNGVYFEDDSKLIDANALSYPGFEENYALAVEYANRDAYVFPTLPSPVPAAAQHGVNLISKAKEIYAQVVTADPDDFDAVWDRMVGEYMSIGGQEVQDQRADAWDAFHG